MESLLELFVSVDDFCQIFVPFWERKLLQDGSRKRHRSGQLSVSEIMTIIIYFYQSHYRTFKAYYREYVGQHLRAEFPNLVSYERFVILMPSVLGPLSAYLKSLYGRCHGISFIDSTALLVCDNHRIHNHKVFAELAQRGKGKDRWVGFMGSSCIWSSMIVANSWLARSAQATSMIAHPFQHSANIYLESSSPIGTMSRSHYLNSSSIPLACNSSLNSAKT